jgi:hypothetical protein
MIPRDVRTRWNSTFDMLDFAVKHITAINTITGDRDMKLRRYELSEDDWDMARQLRDLLKVCSHMIQFYYIINHFFGRYSRTRHYFFLEGHPASPLSYQPWITSTNILPPLQSTTNTLSQSRLPSQLAKKRSTDTITKPIILKCSGSQWV